MSARVGIALALLAAAAAARADVVLNGHFHVGDEDTRVEFTPLDPVDCDRYRANPSTFHLSESATITAFTLHDAIDLNNATFTVDIDRQQQSALSCTTCDSCNGILPCSDITVDLAVAITLGAGDHTVAVVDPSGASGNCNTGNDFGWSKLTLRSTATTTSVMLNQRRHIGDTADADDDYDFSGNQYYPDAAEGTFVDTSFTLGSGRRLTQVLIYRLRDVNNNDAQVRVGGSQIGTLTGNGNPFTVNTSLLLAAGSHTLRVVSGTVSGQRDDISWDDIILRFADTTTSGTPGFFNAVDFPSTSADALTGSITTKVAGGAFALDLYALNGFGTGQDSGYTGIATVEVLNAADNSGTIDVYGCNSSWTVAQSLGTVAFVAGYAQASGAFLDAGLKDARIRVADTTTGAAGCSIDNFAIRPASFLVEPSQDSEIAPGLTTSLTNSGTSGLPRHRAGQPFTIVATARSATGAVVTNYDGTPDATPTAIAPATTNGALTIQSWYAVSPGVFRTDTAKYAEAGPVTITLKDSTWADVDADDTAAGVREFSGTVDAGRFIPDHFKVAEGELAPNCAAGGFSYLGSALNWATPAIILTAVAADGTPADDSDNPTTLNYEGSLATLPAELSQPTYPAPTYAALAGALNTAGLSAPALSAPAAGVSNVTLPALSFARTLIGAFDAEIRIDLPVFTDGDGVAPAESPIVLGALTAGDGVAFTGGFKSQRFGRLYFEPRYGSERLPMVVPLRAEYFDGVAFVPNTADLCTSLGNADVTLSGIGGQTHAVTAAGGGAWNVTLTAPNTAGQATLSIDLASPPVTPAVAYPLLAADSDGDGTYAEDPAGTATFGLYSQDQRWIYQREVVGN